MTFENLINYIIENQTVNISCKSGAIGKGDVFVAVKGTVSDGHDYAASASAAGAEFIVCEKKCRCPDQKAIIVDNSAKAFAVLAQARYGNPSEKLVNLAVTGTNGKTSVCFMTRSIIESAGRKCGLVGTVHYDTGGGKYDAPLTTPDALQLARLSRKMLDHGSEFMAIEASSHALCQHRLDGIDFRSAAFTNLTGDHLDYHLTKANYLAAKTILFKHLSNNATAVLNRQSFESESIAKQTRANVLWYSTGTDGDVTAEIQSIKIGAAVYDIKYNSQSERVVSQLIGEHNISNQLAAAGLAITAGFDLSEIARGLGSLKAVPGRLENVPCNNGFSVFVDYAHTDDALKNVLKTLGPFCKGKLSVLFGCGGNRDKTKRPRMAREAEKYADSIIVTSDNPRTECPDAIIADIMGGFGSTENVKVESNRKKAIKLAIKNASENDIVLIAGKGHETYQIIGRQKLDFDDKQEVLNALEEL